MNHVVVVEFVLEVGTEGAELAAIHAKAIPEKLVNIVGNGVSIVVVDAGFLLHALLFVSRRKNQAIVLYKGIYWQQPFI